MKLFKNLVVVLFAVAMFSACGGGTPESVAKSYVDAGLSFDFEKAAKYSTKEHAADILEGMEDYSKEELKKEIEAVKEEYKGITYKIIEVEVEENEAIVRFEFSKDGKTDDGKVFLIKEANKWKVNDDRIYFRF